MTVINVDKFMLGKFFGKVFRPMPTVLLGKCFGNLRGCGGNQREIGGECRGRHYFALKDAILHHEFAVLQ